MIGSGPNGLCAAILLARAGYRVVVHEAASQIGGGMRSAELTLPGFMHDVCSAVHPMAMSSPCFEQFPLAAHGLDWVHPDVPLAHPLDDGSGVLLYRSIDATAANLGQDGERWRRLFGPFAEQWDGLRHDVLSIPRIPKHPLRMAGFGWYSMQSAKRLAYGQFRGERARALFAGLAAHSAAPLDSAASAGIGLVIGIAAHAVGWPLVRGGSQRLADSLAGYLRSLGGEIRTGSRITALPDADLVMCDVTPRQLLAIAGPRMPDGYRRALARYRYGPGSFKIDWALDAPIPWRAPECARAGTLHLGGTFEEIAAWEARHQGRPFVLLAQPSLFDGTRAPSGKHTAWAYCHVPHGCTQDRTAAIEEQVERFAPGFRARILARSTMNAAELEQHNPNLVGGDIGGGAITLRQIFLRPTRQLHRTPMAGVWLCSSSTPPGGGVHGMCGFNAVQSALGR